MIIADPSALWYLSTQLHKKGHKRLARLIKAYNFVVFRAILPPEASLVAPVKLGHFGFGVVIHPNVSIGREVKLWHGVTLSVSDAIGGPTLLRIGDDVELGAGSVVVTRERADLHICDHVRVGANAVVTRSLTSAGSYGGVPAILLEDRGGRQNC
jgi:serine O-acetyltransferase